jgi:hypothetical protein
MEQRGVFVRLLTIWYRGTPLPPDLLESMGYSGNNILDKTKALS